MYRGQPKKHTSSPRQWRASVAFFKIIQRIEMTIERGRPFEKMGNPSSLLSKWMGLTGVDSQLGKTQEPLVLNKYDGRQLPISSCFVAYFFK